MTAALDRAVTDDPIAPITATLRAMFGTSTRLPGLAPDLLVYGDERWQPAARLADDELPTLLDRRTHSRSPGCHRSGSSPTKPRCWPSSGARCSTSI